MSHKILPTPAPTAPENEAVQALRQILTALEFAEKRFGEIQHEARLRRLYKNILHPIALFLACMVIGTLLCGVLIVVCSWKRQLPSLSTLKWSFTFSALVYYVPLLWWTYKRTGEEDWQPLMWEVHRADQIVLEQNWKDLLEWPEGHPEQLLEDGAKQERIDKALQARRAQCQGELSKERLRDTLTLSALEAEGAGSK